MKYCPLLSFQKEYVNEKYCMGGSCKWADEGGECLIKQALATYITVNAPMQVNFCEPPYPSNTTPVNNQIIRSDTPVKEFENSDWYDDFVVKG
jgi:hypothetical protein